MLNTILGSLSSGVAASTSSYESIATVTATGGETSLTFSSIPSTYASLQIRGLSRRNATGSHTVNVQFNSDTSTNYAYHYLRGVANVGVQVTGVTSANDIRCFSASSATAGSNIFGTGIIDIHDYASTTKNKTVRAFGGYDDNNASNSIVSIQSGLWLNTNAITSITITFAGDAIASGSTFALYGIKG